MDNVVAAAVHSAYLAQIVNYSRVASLTILIANYIQTLDLEIELIWKAKWRLVKILFLSARYSPFLDVPLALYYSMTPLSNQQCFVFYYIRTWSICFGIETSEAILIVRTYALSGNSRKVLIYLTIQYVAICTAVVVVLTLFLRSLRYGHPPLSTIAGCHLVEGSKIIFTNFVLVILFEMTVMIVTICVGMQRYRHSRNPLILTLYRDGIIYFVCLFLLSAANIVVFLAGPPQLLDLVDLFQRVMHSIISTRIVLHVRNAARDRDTDAPISDLRFGSRPGQQKSSTDQSAIFPAANEGDIEVE